MTSTLLILALVLLLAGGLRMADLGNGTTIAGDGTGFSGVITSLQISGIAREAVETTHLGTAQAGAGKFGSKTFIPAKNTDPGEIALEGHFDPDVRPPVENDPEDWTVTWPLPSGMSTPATWVGEGFFTAYEGGAPLDDLMTFSGTIKLSGNQTLTAAA